ncbi:MAG: Methylmalonyl-CoA mutase [Syntrophorhabdus sp. PtaU1.Bin058]|nr:MAG: Methylmalonyl-CoA mutase [Syntrophorhabdus sp. PtaU1.Bin058]
MKDELEKIAKEKQKWQDRCVRPALKRFNREKNPTRFYTPLDLPEFDFLERVGFPGEYPFTAGTYPFFPYQSGLTGTAHIPQAPGLARAGRYSGYGTAEDYRDYHKQMQALGAKSGPNIAFDLPTQLGYDSDSTMSLGEVGRVGVAVDTLRDFEVIYEAFTGGMDIDRIASNWTINAPANIIIAMYVALAEKRGIGIEKLRATPQNDILKEFLARGAYIFPPRPSMKMLRDSMLFITRHLPNCNILSIGGYHMREAGATREQDLAFSMSIGAAYLKEGVNAGLDIDSFAPKFTFNVFGGSMEFYKEIAFQRAVRRMWAKIIKEQFGAKDQRSMLLRAPQGAHVGCISTTLQRPLNNLTRTVVGAMAGAMAGGPPNVWPPYDEPLGLGWSLEANQLSEDGMRILQLEARICDVIDPFAGSYFMESLTNEIEEAGWEEFHKIEEMGGTVAAIENGYMQRKIADGAYERQKRIENGEDLIVGVNCFTGEHELNVTTTRLVSHPYDPEKRELAEERQLEVLKKVKRSRDNNKVLSLLRDLKTAARREEENLIPRLVECVKEYATIQEMCDVLREVFGEYKPS